MKVHRETRKDLLEIIADSPVIAAVKDEEGLDKSLRTDCRIIFILYGNICSLTTIVEKIKKRDKLAIVHTDLIHYEIGRAHV